MHAFEVLTVVAPLLSGSGPTTTLTAENAHGLLATIEPTAVNSSGTRYTTSDHLGSPRVVTNSGDGPVSRHDYMPFGEELGAGIGGRITAMGFPGTSDGLRQKFSSKERDVETGLDYFAARYYGSTQGRFTSTDPLLSTGRPDDPQSWHRYSYTLNNPLAMIDPTGLFSFGANLTDDEKKKIAEAYNKLKEALSKLKAVFIAGLLAVSGRIPLTNYF